MPGGREVLKCAVHRGFPLRNLVSNLLPLGTWGRGMWDSVGAHQPSKPRTGITQRADVHCIPLILVKVHYGAHRQAPLLV